jgi:hypothetical protein
LALARNFEKQKSAPSSENEAGRLSDRSLANSQSGAILCAGAIFQSQSA